MASPEFVAQLQGWRLATARILYRIPDHPILLQTFVWQTTIWRRNFRASGGSFNSGNARSKPICIRWRSLRPTEFHPAAGRMSTRSF